MARFTHAARLRGPAGGVKAGRDGTPCISSKPAQIRKVGHEPFLRSRGEQSANFQGSGALYGGRTGREWRMSDYGWLWLVMNVGFVAILAGALIYGISMWRKRTRAQEIAGERKAEQLSKSHDE
jgi:hypothetical protein